MTAPVQNATDTLIEIRGYASDPKLVGYQILTNYESTYWRALVGNDAWGLYEVLRSFCHEGNNVCRPSVNLLMAILGIKERRVLTGWTKQVKGKEYTYHGLIETLQQYDLATAEVKGEGPELRYLFHVNLTPSLLPNKYLATLPEPLRKKHAELLERCEQAKRELQGKRRPVKVKVSEEVSESEVRGSGNLPEGSDNLPEGSGNLPDKQYPYNTTQRTVTTIKNENNNSREANLNNDVVVALLERGISKGVAQRLANHYKRERVFEKIEFLAFLQEAKPNQVKDTGAWLRRAIEDDFAKPAGYISRGEREAAEKARQQAEEEQQRKFDTQMAQEAAELERRRNIREKQLSPLKRRYKTSEQEEKIWSETLSHLQAASPAAVKLFLSDSVLLSLVHSTAVIWLSSSYAREQVEREFGLTIKRLLAKRLKVSHGEVTLNFVFPGRAEEDNGESPDNSP